MPEYHDVFLDGNEQIEEAIGKFYEDSSKESLAEVLEVIRQRMHADGHFIFPVLVNEADETQFAFRTVQTQDGKLWNAAFTSQAEYEKGAQSTVVSFFIDSTLKHCLETGPEGFIINPWGQSFQLTKNMIQSIFDADGDVEYTVSGEPLTKELLEDGSFLKKALEICVRNHTQLNLIKLARILRDSVVWIPCNAVMSDADYNALKKMVGAGDGTESVEGQTFVTGDELRLVPDILKNGEDFYFPVFSTAEEMGDYGKQFSSVPSSFLDAIGLARNNEKKVSGVE